MVYPLLNPRSANSSSLPRSRIALARTEVGEPVAAFCRRLAAVAIHDPLLLIWQMVTAPFWIGSGVPLPARPARRAVQTWQTSQTPQADSTSFQAVAPAVYLESHLQSLARRFWIAWICSSAIRGFTLGTLAGTVWTIAGVLDLGDPPHATGLIALIAIGSLLGIAFGSTTRPSTVRIAAMLDRTFHLDERLTTAFDPSLTSAPSSAMRRLQLADAANAFAEIREDIHGAAVLPIREAVIGVLAGICLITALLFNIAGSPIPATANAVVPAFVPSSERFARQQQELESQQRAALTQPAKASRAPDESANAAKDLSTVGAALDTQPITKPASDNISAGNFGGASQSLRDAASAAGSLPQADREALAKKLDDAAASISPENPDLAKASKQAASDLRAGGDQATSGINDLADQIDTTGKKATSQDKGANGSQPETSASNSSSDQQRTTDSPSQQGQSPSGQSQQGSQQTKQSQSSSSTGNDPGSGMAAQPGIGSEPQKSASDGQEGQPGGAKAGSGESSQTQSGAGSQQAGQQPGTGSGSTQQNGTGKSSSSSSGSGGPQSQQSEGNGSSGKPGSSSNPQTGSDPSQSAGTGSGAGQSNSNDQANSPQNTSSGGAGADQKITSDPGRTGKAGDPPPGNTDSSKASTDNPTAQSGDQSLVLQGTSEKDSIGTGNDIGSSSSGSGSADGTAAGNATQGEVGPAGPDSNHVPDAYRDVVKGYFNGDGTTP